MEWWEWVIFTLALAASFFAGATTATALFLWWITLNDTEDLALTVRVLRDKLCKAEEVAETVLELKRQLGGNNSK